MILFKKKNNKTFNSYTKDANKANVTFKKTLYKKACFQDRITQQNAIPV